MLRAAATRATSAARGLSSRGSHRNPIGGGGGGLKFVRGFAGHGGGDMMPVPQSAHAQLWQGHPHREGWESTMTFWYGTSFLLLVGILGFAPNTDITSWAREEALARRRKGGAVEFGTHSFNIVQENRDATWDKFAVRAIRMTEDDDDDEDEEDEDEAEDEDDDE